MPRSRSTASRATRRNPADQVLVARGSSQRRKRSGGPPTAIRIAEAVGSSPRSWDAAVTDAVRGARDEAPEPIAVEVTRLWADLDGRKRLTRYRAAVKIAYRLPLTAPTADGRLPKTPVRRRRSASKR